jgi:hypothetical protein
VQSECPAKQDPRPKNFLFCVICLPREMLALPALWSASAYSIGVECLPREIEEYFTGAQLIQLGRSLFHWGEICGEILREGVCVGLPRHSLGDGGSAAIISLCTRSL